MMKSIKVLFIIIFISVVSGCSDKRNDLTMDDIYYISLGDGKNKVVDKIGEPHKKIESDDAYSDLKDVQETTEDLYAKLKDEKLLELYDRAEIALESDYLEEWIYNYKDKDGKKEKYTLYFDKKEVVYTPSLQNK